MKRVLIVVSAYGPAMIADMQRARMLAWELPSLGWDVEILTPDASEVRQDVVESDSDCFFNPNVKVHKAKSVCRSFFRLAGIQSHAWPTFYPMYQKGLKLLKSKRFHLVYITTTCFNFFAFGPMWKKSTNVPYILDYHDPWIRDTNVGKLSLKSRINRLISTKMEQNAIAHTSGLVSVSPNYLTGLEDRYSELKLNEFFKNSAVVIPFGCRQEDFSSTANVPNHSLQIAYVGAGGNIMQKSFETLCRSLQSLRQKSPEVIDGIKFVLKGTIYRWNPGDARELFLVAERFGVGDLVEEEPRRVSYRQSIECLMSSQGALILGVDDQGYMPSKLFPYALSGKPLLASLHRQSPAFALFESVPGIGNAIWFDDRAEMNLDEVNRVVSQFLFQVRERQAFDRRDLLSESTAAAMSKRHSIFFDHCLSAATVK